jgi:succinoglycan biosynthesis transport protein ExoP
MTNVQLPAVPLPRQNPERAMAPLGEFGFGKSDSYARLSWERPFRDRSNSETESLNVGSLFGVLRRRWMLIVSAVALLTTLSTLVVLHMAPRYSAQAFVMLDTRKTQVVNIEAVMSGLSTDTAVIRSEVDVLSSPMLAGRVVDELHLENNPQFNRWFANAPATPGWQTLVSHWISSAAGELLPPKWLDNFPFGRAELGTTSGDDHAPSNQLSAAQKREQIIEALLARLTVANDGKSYGIRLTFQWEDPEIAASVANTLAKLYIADQIDAKGHATRVANSWLNARVVELRDVVHKSDMAVQLYRVQHHIYQGAQKGTTITQQQLSALQSQLLAAAAEEVQKDAALRSRDHGAGGSALDNSILTSPLIQQLRAQEAELARKEASIRAHYGDRYPELIETITQLQNLRTTVQAESAKLARGSTIDLASLKARVAQLHDAVTAAEQAEAEEDEANVRLIELEREADADQNLYKSFLSRYLETSKQEDLQMADARIISLATVPTRPTFPNSKLFIELAVLFSIFAGTGLAFVLERFDSSFRRLDQLPAIGCLGLGILPAVRGGRRNPTRVADEIVHHPASAYSESVRGIRNALHMSSGNGIKTILVTSAEPREGKTLFAVSMARSMVKSGRRVLLIDCDLRQPGVGKILAAKHYVDLESVVCQGVDLDSVVQIDAATGLHYIASAKADLKSGSYIDFIDSDAFWAFLNLLKASYDAIIIDSPAVQVVSDAIVLARYTDSMVFLVRWGRTPRSIAISAMERLAMTGVTLAGVIVSQVDLRKHARYRDAGGGTFHDHYNEVYRSGHRVPSGGGAIASEVSLKYD